MQTTIHKIRTFSEQIQDEGMRTTAIVDYLYALSEWVMDGGRGGSMTRTGTKCKDRPQGERSQILFQRLVDELSLA